MITLRIHHKHHNIFIRHFVMNLDISLTNHFTSSNPFFTPRRFYPGPLKPSCTPKINVPNYLPKIPFSSPSSSTINSVNSYNTNIPKDNEIFSNFIDTHTNTSAFSKKQYLSKSIPKIGENDHINRLFNRSPRDEEIWLQKTQEPTEYSLVVYNKKQAKLNILWQQQVSYKHDNSIFYADNKDGVCYADLKFVNTDSMLPVNLGDATSSFGQVIMHQIFVKNVPNFNIFNNNIYTPIPSIMKNFLTSHGISYDTYVNKQYNISSFNTADDLKQEALKRQLLQANKSPSVNVIDINGNKIVAGDEEGAYSLTKDGYAFYDHVREAKLVPIEKPIDQNMAINKTFDIIECQLAVIKSKTGSLIKPAIQTHIIVVYNGEGNYCHAFMNLTSKKHGALTNLCPTQFKKYQDICYGKIFTAEENKKPHLNKPQKGQFFDNIVAISKEDIIFLSHGNNYIKQFDKSVITECNQQLDKLQKNSIKRYNAEAISKHDVLEIVKQYDFFAKENRSNFPKTQEQIDIFKEAKMKQQKKQAEYKNAHKF